MQEGLGSQGKGDSLVETTGDRKPIDIAATEAHSKPNSTSKWGSKSREMNLREIGVEFPLGHDEGSKHTRPPDRIFDHNYQNLQNPTQNPPLTYIQTEKFKATGNHKETAPKPASGSKTSPSKIQQIQPPEP